MAPPQQGTQVTEELTAAEYTLLLKLLRRHAQQDPAYRPGMEYREMTPVLRQLGRMHTKLWAQRERRRGRPVTMTRLGRDGSVYIERV